jgi:hypothetical protein
MDVNQKNMIELNQEVLKTTNLKEGSEVKELFESQGKINVSDEKGEAVEVKKQEETTAQSKNSEKFSKKELKKKKQEDKKRLKKNEEKNFRQITENEEKDYNENKLANEEWQEVKPKQIRRNENFQRDQKNPWGKTKTEIKTVVNSISTMEFLELEGMEKSQDNLTLDGAVFVSDMESERIKKLEQQKREIKQNEKTQNSSKEKSKWQEKNKNKINKKKENQTLTIERKEEKNQLTKEVEIPDNTDMETLSPINNNNNIDLGASLSEQHEGRSKKFQDIKSKCELSERDLFFDMKEEGIVKEKPLLKKGSEESVEYKNKKIIEKEMSLSPSPSVSSLSPSVSSVLSSYSVENIDLSNTRNNTLTSSGITSKISPSIRNVSPSPSPKSNMMIKKFSGVATKINRFQQYSKEIAMDDYEVFEKQREDLMKVRGSKLDPKSLERKLITEKGGRIYLDFEMVEKLRSNEYVYSVKFFHSFAEIPNLFIPPEKNFNIDEDVKKAFANETHLNSGNRSPMKRNDPPHYRGNSNIQFTQISKVELPHRVSNAWRPKQHTTFVESVGDIKMTAEEQTKKILSFLNRITPVNFNEMSVLIFLHITELVKKNDEGADLRSRVMESFVKDLYMKAVFEKKYVRLYASLCKRLNDFEIECNKQKEKEQLVNEESKDSFRRAIINIVQKQFESNHTLTFTEEEEHKLTPKQKEERHEIHSIQMKGNAYFVGELINIQVLSIERCNSCVNSLLNQPNEEKLLLVAKLLEAVGSTYYRNGFEYYTKAINQIKSILQFRWRNNVKFALLNVVDMFEKKEFKLYETPEYLKNEYSLFDSEYYKKYYNIMVKLPEAASLKNLSSPSPINDLFQFLPPSSETFKLPFCINNLIKTVRDVVSGRQKNKSEFVKALRFATTGIKSLGKSVIKREENENEKASVENEEKKIVTLAYSLRIVFAVVLGECVKRCTYESNNILNEQSLKVINIFIESLGIVSTETTFGIIEAIKYITFEHSGLLKIINKKKTSLSIEDSQNALKNAKFEVMTKKFKLTTEKGVSFEIPKIVGEENAENVLPCISPTLLLHHFFGLCFEKLTCNLIGLILSEGSLSLICSMLFFL